MKYLNRSFPALAAIAALLFVSSCDTESDPIVPEPDLAVVDDDVAVNAAFEDLDNLTLEVFLSGDDLDLDARVLASFDGPICDDTEVTVDEEAKMITVDFGTGCTDDGVTRKGKVFLSYSGELEPTSFLFPGFTLTATFEGYEVNGLQIAGTRVIRNLGVDIINGSIRVAVEVRDGVVTWPDGTFVTYTSDQVRDLVFGDISEDIGNYEATITGTAAGKTRAGFDYTARISTPLLITQTCIDSGILTPSLGVITFQYRGIEVGLDYGFGTCDDVVTITYPGGAKEITLD